MPGAGPGLPGWPNCARCGHKMHPAVLEDGFRIHATCEPTYGSRNNGRSQSGYAIPTPY